MKSIRVLCAGVGGAWSRTRVAVSVLVAALILSASSGLAADKRSGVAPSIQTGITIAVTGDIYTPDAKVVSDVILAKPELTAVLLVGDTCNSTPTPLREHNKLYPTTYGRFLAKIHPAPGNHDKLSEPPFSAYSAFWGDAAHSPNLYYSFDLGQWHVVSLNSVALKDGGPAAKAQLDWLKADLAAKPGKPTIVYWHYPFFSRAKHCGDKAMKPFWTEIYSHGPALVFCGHNHVYERFPPLDPDGNPVALNKGIQEFVIGPGGARPTESEAPKAKPPASQKFDGNAQHVGFFTLFADGSFKYTIEAVGEDGAAAVVDSGSGKLAAK